MMIEPLLNSQPDVPRTWSFCRDGSLFPGYLRGPGEAQKCPLGQCVSWLGREKPGHSEAAALAEGTPSQLSPVLPPWPVPLHGGHSAPCSPASTGRVYFPGSLAVRLGAVTASGPGVWAEVISITAMLGP